MSWFERRRPWMLGRCAFWVEFHSVSWLKCWKYISKRETQMAFAKILGNRWWSPKAAMQKHKITQYWRIEKLWFYSLHIYIMLGFHLKKWNKRTIFHLRTKSKGKKMRRNAKSLQMLLKKPIFLRHQPTTKQQNNKTDIYNEPTLQLILNQLCDFKNCPIQNGVALSNW